MMNVVTADTQLKRLSLADDPATDDDFQSFSGGLCLSTGKDEKFFSENEFRSYQKRRFLFNVLAEQLKTKCLPSPEEDLDEDATASTVASSVSFATSRANEHQDETETTEPAIVASSTSFAIIPASKRRVRFGSLTIHAHVMELGGSGLPGSGPAVSLGWKAESHVTIPSVEVYDDRRPYLPRKGIEMLQPKKYRVNMLLDRGYTLNQIQLCMKECEAIRKQRIRTVLQLSFAAKTKSKLKKLAVWKKSRSEVRK
jgi:hypothetical protein